ncbi:coiled-coil domain-containing protein 142 [Athalia rosae]|uniref:coiled-coil domain-containing protein 142 n=1 Tax=Athalia rosae TaxID=37344 RepID=UPI00203459D2|nr:coiled-coil domain-containing protein 142 [Athalia rosae]
MDNNYRTNVAKWLPPVNSMLEEWYENCLLLHKSMRKLTEEIISTTGEIESSNNCYHKNLEDILTSLEALLKDYESIKQVAYQKHPVHKYKVEHFKTLIKRRLNVVAKITRDLINDILDCKHDVLLNSIFRFVNTYNKILDLDLDVTDLSTNIFHNDCPSMIEPLKKISITRLLQILAKNRAEDYCHELIECLLANYHPEDGKTELKSTTFADAEISENSSIEIYRALTKHMTPPIASVTLPGTVISNIESIQTLVNAQNELIVNLLNVAKELSPKLFGLGAIKVNQGESRLRKAALRKATDYYQEVAWGAVSSILDHVVLWWSPEALASRHSQGALHLKDWLHQFIQANEVPPTVSPALQNLCDALGCHVTTTAWDQIFRSAYTSAFNCQSKPLSTEGTDTGQMFAELFALLVSLSNECEVGGEWVVGAPLIELPISEQIMVLHRMDHSVHMMRLWAMQEASRIAHTWDLNAFFLLVRGDLKNCIEELSYLKLADHTNALASESVNVQVYVCTRMRAKIASEVNANIQLLKDSPLKCIQTLAKICRTVSLANLHMCFPRPIYWRNNTDAAPTMQSFYVATYLEKVLLPVLEVVEDYEISNMILKIMCESWLDYIYLHRIKFSEWGALQLLTDFAFVKTWLMECSIISQTVKGHLLKNEVLRRCEGVGRLLLRHPGEAITMRKKPVRSNSASGSPESLGLERMPAEMYVPNQEQWLELRASKRCSFFCIE